MSAINKIGLSRVEQWVDRHSTWLAMGIIAVAFAIRVFYSVSCYLNPDEGGHFDVAAANSWVETMKAALRLAHPPLFILVLHAFLFLGRTELFVRLPSLIGGTAALWFVFAWIRRILGGVLALGGLGFMALSPLAISASVEVRQYGILLFFLCAALYATEVTFAERSTRWAILQGLFLLGAFLTHYTALVPLACIGFYVLVRSLVSGVPRRILYIFLLFQLIIVTLLGVLYFGQVRGLIPFGRGASLDYLQHFYYTPAQETPFQFVWRSISGTFLHAAGPVRLSYLFMFLFVIGLAALQMGRFKTSRFMALLVVSPFLVGFVAAIMQVFPFGGSRHQTYLLPFLAAGIAAALSWLPRVSVVPVLLLGVVIAPHWISRALPDNNLQVDPLSDMTAAMEYVKQTIPPGATIYVDYETRQVLRYHLARNDWFPRTLQSGPAAEQWYAGYRVVVPRENIWVFKPDEVLGQVTETARQIGAQPGEPLWVVSVAWADPSFASRFPVGQSREVKEFGMISVIRFPAQTR